MDSDEILREQLLALLHGGNAHLSFEDAVAEFPLGAINARPPQVSYTPWHLLEHLRIAQWDILEFVRDPKHISPPWPVGYWPAQDKEADETQWLDTINRFREDLSGLEGLVKDKSVQLERADPARPRVYNLARSPTRRRPQRLSHRRICDIEANHGDVARQESLGLACTTALSSSERVISGRRGKWSVSGRFLI